MADESQYVSHCSSFWNGVRVLIEDTTTTARGGLTITACGPDVPIKCATVIKNLLFCVRDASSCDGGNNFSSVRRVELYSLTNPRECIGAVDMPDIVLALGGSPQCVVVVTAFAALWYAPIETFCRSAVPTLECKIPSGIKLCAICGDSICIVANEQPLEVKVVNRITKREIVIQSLHHAPIRAVAISSDGSKVATVSENGTVIRVWDVACTADKPSFELRPSKYRSHVNSLAFGGPTGHVIALHCDYLSYLSLLGWPRYPMVYAFDLTKQIPSSESWCVPGVGLHGTLLGDSTGGILRVVPGEGHQGGSGQWIVSYDVATHQVVHEVKL